MEFQNLLRYTIISASVATLVACSSADTGTATTPAAPTPVTISGSVFAAPVSQATLTVKNTSGDTVAGPITTNPDSTYTIDILDTDLAGDLVFESSGGEFTDEETGTANVVAGAMSAFVEGGSLTAGGSTSVHVTPDSTIYADLVTKYSKTPTEAQSIFFKTFAHNMTVSVEPVDITDPASFNADDASRYAGWLAAVFSRLASTLTLAPADQFDMFAAIAEDLSDGTMDGMDASAADILIGTTGVKAPTLKQYVDATESFDMAEAANLKVTYTPPMMNIHGKNTFTLTITDTAGNPVPGLIGGTDLKVMPMMYMADRMHATPVGDIVETDPGVSGIYNVTAYYLMPSRMMDGTTMGTWDLKVMAGMKTVHFYPNISMAMMNNTAKVALKGVNDEAIMMGLPSPRPYHIFRDGNPVVNGANYDFNLFITPMETMMSFPPLVDQMTLNPGETNEYLVDGIDIHVSVNDGAWDQNKDIDNTDGTWTLNALQLDTDPVNPTTNTIKVRLIVSGETKTTDGLDVVADTNDFATFTVTMPATGP
jgi:hypothetical protein